jgi:hypothetical protein
VVGQQIEEVRATGRVGGRTVPYASMIRVIKIREKIGLHIGTSIEIDKRIPIVLLKLVSLSKLLINRVEIHIR